MVPLLFKNSKMALNPFGNRTLHIYMRFHFLSFADVYEPMCPTNIKESTDNGSNGANVSFSMRFTDNVDPSPTANCDHQSGATYPVGTTVVTCNVTDSSSNINQCNFNITITGN